MADLVEHLRQQASRQDMLTCEDMLRAADEITRLRAEVERLQAKVHELEDVDRNLHDMRVARDAEIERLRTTLRVIVDGDVFQFWWEARDICRRALGDTAP